MMKIGLVLAGNGIGGVTAASLRLARGLAMEGHEITVYYVTGSRGQSDCADDEPFNSVYLGKRRARNGFLELMRLQSSGDLDVLISAQNYLNVIVAAARPARHPNVLLLVDHTSLNASLASSPIRRRLLISLVKFCYKRADLVAAVSDGVACEVKRLLGAGRNVIVLPNPVFSEEHDLARARGIVARKSPLQPAEVPVILSAGRLSPEKRLPDLLRAFELVHAQREARLVIVGDGPERESLERLVIELGIQGSVEFVGYSTEVRQFMARADLFVLCSEFEGLPTTLIEAVGNGCRVVSTDCPHGPREILEGGRLGALVPVGKPVVLSSSILVALDSPAPSLPDVENLVRFFSERECASRYLDAVSPLVSLGQ